MTLYLKTMFDTKVRKFNASKVSMRFKNDSEINMEEFPAFMDIENTGLLEIKANPLELKRWWDSLSDHARDGNYVLTWDGGWISIPGSMIESVNVE